MKINRCKSNIQNLRGFIPFAAVYTLLSLLILYLINMIYVREPEVAYGKNKFTADEYLEFEKASALKYEFYKGEIFAMSGAEARHNKIFSNLFGHMHHALKGKQYRPYGRDLRIHIPQHTLYT